MELSDAPRKRGGNLDANAAKAIPREVALRLCEEIRTENRGKWYTFNGLWCLGCTTFNQADQTKMCWHSSPQNRGCGQVNKRHAEQPRPESEQSVPVSARLKRQKE